MRTAKKHATHGITGFELAKQTLNNLSQYDITPVAKLVLLYLVDCYNPKNGLEVFPKQKTIASKLGVSERSVTRAIQELFKARLILIECKSSNRYFLRLKNDCGASELKNFSTDSMSNDFGQKNVQNEDKLAHPHVHEQTKEQKNNKSDDFYIEKAVENKHWVKNKVAYINKVKREGGQNDLIREGKALVLAEKNNKAMLNLTQQVIEARKEAEELAVPPTDYFKEIGKKLRMQSNVTKDF